MKRDERKRLEKALRKFLAGTSRMNEPGMKLGEMGDAAFDEMACKGVNLSNDDLTASYMVGRGLTLQEAYLYVKWLRSAYSE